MTMLLHKVFAWHNCIKLLFGCQCSGKCHQFNVLNFDFVSDSYTHFQKSCENDENMRAEDHIIGPRD